MKRIISISLLFIFLSGQLHLTWATQFCGESEVTSSLMLGHGYLDCCEVETRSCDNSDDSSDESSFAPPACCRVDYYSADSDDYFKHNQTLLTSQVLFASGYVISFYENTDSNEQTDYFIAASPPLTHANRLILHQTFLL